MGQRRARSRQIHWLNVLTAEAYGHDRAHIWHNTGKRHGYCSILDHVSSIGAVRETKPTEFTYIYYKK